MAILSTMLSIRTRVREYIGNQSNVTSDARLLEAINEAFSFLTASTRCLSMESSTTLKSRALVTTADPEYYGKYYLPTKFLDFRPDNPVAVKISATGDYKNLDPASVEDLAGQSEEGDTTTGDLSYYMLYRDAVGFYVQLYPIWNGTVDVTNGLRMYYYVLHDELTAVTDVVDLREHMRMAVPALAASSILRGRRQFKDADYYETWALRQIEPFLQDKDLTTDKETAMGLQRIDGEHGHRVV